MKNGTSIIWLFAVVAGCATHQKETYDSTRSSQLWTSYEALERKEQHIFLSNLSADDMFAFTLAVIPAHVRNRYKEVEVDFMDLRIEAFVGMLGGDYLETWGEKRLAEGRRLTASVMIGVAEDTKLPQEWRSSFRGYMRILLFANPGRPRTDPYEIGLTDHDINTLKDYLQRTSKGDPRKLE